MADDPLANWTPIAPAGSQDGVGPDPLAGWHPLGDSGQSSVAPTASYPEMTPQPRLTDTSFHSLPSDTRPGTVKDDGAPARIREAAAEGWKKGAGFLTPEAWDWVQSHDPTGGVVSGALSIPSQVIGAVGAAVPATVGELATAAGAPALGRDINIGMQTVPPLVMAAAPLRGPAMTTAPEAAPRVAPPTLDMGTAEARANARAATAPPGVAVGPTSDTGIPGVMQPPPGYQPPFSAPATAKQAFTEAGQRYATADAAGGAINDTANNRFVTQLAKDHPPDPQVQTFNRGPTLVDQTVADFQNAMKGQNLSLSTFQGIDKALGDRIETALNAGNKAQASELMSMRSALRDHVENATQADTVGGNATGFSSLSDARQAWSTAVKMQDVERMRANAELAGATGGNTAGAFQSQVRSFLRNDSNTRGWTDAEKSALLSAARTGTYDEIYRTLGSRLVPIGSTVAGGIGGGLAAGAGGAVFSSLMRDAMANRMLSKAQEALGVIGQGMPRPQATPGPSLIPRVAALPQPGYMTGLLGSAAFPPRANQQQPGLLQVPSNYQPPQL